MFITMDKKNMVMLDKEEISKIIGKTNDLNFLYNSFVGVGPKTIKTSMDPKN